MGETWDISYICYSILCLGCKAEYIKVSVKRFDYKSAMNYTSNKTTQQTHEKTNKNKHTQKTNNKQTHKPYYYYYYLFILNNK